MNSQVLLRLLALSLALGLWLISSVEAQNGPSSGRKLKKNNTRLLQLVEANIIATHAFQVLSVSARPPRFSASLR